MKKLNTHKSLIVGLFAAASLLYACDLEEVNPSGATGEAIWSTPEGFVTLVNASYTHQRQMFGKFDGIFNYETGTDLWFNQQLDGFAEEISKYVNLVPGAGNTNRKGWSVPWEAINLCNAGINRIDDAGYKDIKEKNARLGELRFLRAFYYYYIVEMYGGVMLRTEETKEPLLTAERSPVEDFYDLMISDLRFAQKHLPLDQGDEYSRASKKSAMGFLTRVLLSRAYYENGTPYYQQVIDLADSIIGGQDTLGVELWENFEDIWKAENNANNKEAMYMVSNSDNTALNFDDNANRLHLWFVNRYNEKPGLELSLEYGGINERRFMPTLKALDIFDETIDGRYYGSFREVWLCNVEGGFTWDQQTADQYGKDASVVGTTINPGDTALIITKNSVTGEEFLPYVVIDRDAVYNTSDDNSIITGEDYVQLTKYEDPTRADASLRPSYLDIFIVRFAEVYLNAAEAAFQLGNYSKAAEMLNVLRTRAAIKTPVDRTADMQVDATEIENGGIEFIMDERARELAGEHIRWLDVKRVFQNTPSDFVSFIKERNPNITSVQEHHILRPIPQEEMDRLLNREEFGQNPGY